MIEQSAKESHAAHWLVRSLKVGGDFVFSLDQAISARDMVFQSRINKAIYIFPEVRKALCLFLFAVQ